MHTKLCSVPKIKGRREASLLFLPRKGLKRAAPVGTLVQKLRAGEQFLARGRVQISKAASQRGVDLLIFAYAQKIQYDADGHRRPRLDGLPYRSRLGFFNIIANAVLSSLCAYSYSFYMSFAALISFTPYEYPFAK